MLKKLQQLEEANQVLGVATQILHLEASPQQQNPLKNQLERLCPKRGRRVTQTTRKHRDFPNAMKIIKISSYNSEKPVIS